MFGADYIAGYAAAGKLQNMVNTIFIAFGATIATFVGQNRGAGRLDRVRQGVKDTQIMILIAAAASFLIIHFFAGKLTLIFVDSSKTVVIDAANQYFKTVFLVLSVSGQHLPLPESRFREWVRTGADAGRCV